jgi:hypothetical protein
MNAKQQWWYVYDREGKLVHTCKAFTESGAIADAVDITRRNPAMLAAQTTVRMRSPK